MLSSISQDGFPEIPKVGKLTEKKQARQIIPSSNL